MQTLINTVVHSIKINDHSYHSFLDYLSFSISSNDFSFLLLVILYLLPEPLVVPCLVGATPPIPL